MSKLSVRQENRVAFNAVAEAFLAQHLRAGATSRSAMISLA
jgi:hypothetical protein